MTDMSRRKFFAVSGMLIPGVALRAQGERGWQPNPALLQELERRKVAWTFRESAVPPYTLPDPLTCQDGFRVTTAKDWELKRRPETLELFRKFVYGRAPGTSVDTRYEVMEADERAVDGKATRKLVKITCSLDGKSFAFRASLLSPNSAKKRVPVFLLINNRLERNADPLRLQKDGFWPVEEILARGYATAVFRTVDVDPDANGEAARAQGVRGVWPAGGGKVGEDAWGTIAAWAWGASRTLDYLRTDHAVDGEKVGVIGHSRGGKTALWAGAEDQRFAMVISNDSGCGGAALSRRRFGETVEAINHGFPYWFCENFKRFNRLEDQMPVDQHQLLALIAPRAVNVGSADADFWADQRGEFLSLAHASKVYALYGYPTIRDNEMPSLESPLLRGRLGYHIRRGEHNLTPYDWKCYMDAADRLWDTQAG